MDVTRIRALRGPNLWSRHTALQAHVQCTPDEVRHRTRRHVGAPFARAPAGRGLRQLQRQCRARVAGRAGWNGSPMALQAESGCGVSFSRTVATPEAGVYQVVVEYSQEAVGLKALAFAEALLSTAVAGQPFDTANAVAELRALDEDIRLGPSTGCIVSAATTRGIPHRRLTDGSLVQFGWGSRQRRIWAAEVDRTSAVAESIAKDKKICAKPCWRPRVCRCLGPPGR